MNISEQTYENSSAPPRLIDLPEPVVESVVDSLDHPTAELVEVDPATLAEKSGSTDLLTRRFENSHEDKHEIQDSQFNQSKDNSATTFSPSKEIMEGESLKKVEKESMERESTLGEIDQLRDTVSDMSERTISLDSVKQTSAGGPTGKLRARLAKVDNWFPLLWLPPCISSLNPI